MAVRWHNEQTFLSRIDFGSRGVTAEASFVSIASKYSLEMPSAGFGVRPVWASKARRSFAVPSESSGALPISSTTALTAAWKSPDKSHLRIIKRYFKERAEKANKQQTKKKKKKKRKKKEKKKEKKKKKKRKKKVKKKKKTRTVGFQSR
jgi:hypothetical protein